MKVLFYIVATVAILCGFVFPQAGKYTVLIPHLIILILFFNFLDLKVDPRQIIRKELLITFLLSFIAMPLMTYYGLAAGFAEPFRIGLLLVACAPAGIMGIILIQYIGHGDVELAFSNLLFSTFCAVLCIPLLLKLLLGKSIVVEIRPIIMQTALLVILPFLATRLAVHVFPERIQLRIKAASRLMVPLLVFFTLWITFGSASGELKWKLDLLLLSLTTLGVYLLHAGLGLLLGNMIGGKEIRNTLTFISSSRNCHFILAIAVMNFPPLVAVPIIIASLFHHVTNAFWLWALRR